MIHARAHRAGRAFTLVEVIVVLLMLGILSGLIVPRLLRSERRLADNECQEAARLLSAAAKRSALGSQSVSVKYDAESRTMHMYVLQRMPNRRGDSDIQEWVQDPLVRPVKLVNLSYRRGMTDSQSLGERTWNMVFPPSEPRPVVWLLFAAKSDADAAGWQVELLPDDMGATRRGASEQSRASIAGLLRIDLDATNQGEKAW